MRSMGIQRLSALLLAFTGTASVLATPVQKDGLQLPAGSAENRQAVIDMFTRTFNNYTYVLELSNICSCLLNCLCIQPVRQWP